MSEISSILLLCTYAAHLDRTRTKSPDEIKQFVWSSKYSRRRSSGNYSSSLQRDEPAMSQRLTYDVAE